MLARARALAIDMVRDRGLGRYEGVRTKEYPVPRGSHADGSGKEPRQKIEKYEKVKNASTWDLPEWVKVAFYHTASYAVLLALHILNVCLRMWYTPYRRWADGVNVDPLYLFGITTVLAAFLGLRVQNALQQYNETYRAVVRVTTRMTFHVSSLEATFFDRGPTPRKESVMRAARKGATESLELLRYYFHRVTRGDTRLLNMYALNVKHLVVLFAPIGAYGDKGLFNPTNHNPIIASILETYNDFATIWTQSLVSVPIFVDILLRFATDFAILFIVFTVPATAEVTIALMSIVLGIVLIYATLYFGQNVSYFGGWSLFDIDVDDLLNVAIDDIRNTTTLDRRAQFPEDGVETAPVVSVRSRMTGDIRLV